MGRFMMMQVLAAQLFLVTHALRSFGHYNRMDDTSPTHSKRRGKNPARERPSLDQENSSRRSNTPDGSNAATGVANKKQKQVVTDRFEQEKVQRFHDAFPSLLNENLSDDSPGHQALIKNLIRSSRQLINVPNQADKSKTSVHLAAQSGKAWLVKLLLEDFNGDVTKTDCNNATPLHYASESGDELMIQTLLQFGADACQKNRAGHAAIHTAAAAGNVTILSQLLQNAESCLTHVDNAGNTILHVAVMAKHIPVVNFLLDQPATQSILDVKNAESKTALYIAAEDGSHTIVASLLYTKVRDETGQVVDVRARAGVDVNTSKSEFNFGATPLFAACVCGHTEVAKVLLSRFDIDTKQKSTGWTPAAAAKNSDQKDIVKLFKKRNSKFPCCLPRSDHPTAFLCEPEYTGE